MLMETYREACTRLWLRTMVCAGLLMFLFFVCIAALVPHLATIRSAQDARLYLGDDIYLALGYMVLGLLNILWYLRDGLKLQKLRGKFEQRPGVILRK